MDRDPLPVRIGQHRSLRYEERCSLQRAALDAAAQELIDVCRELPGIREVYAFGSYALGNVGPTSDLDVLIIRETELPRVERERDIRLAVQAPVGYDFLVITPEEYLTKLPTTSFGRDIIRQAQLLAKYSQADESTIRNA